MIQFTDPKGSVYVFGKKGADKYEELLDEFKVGDNKKLYKFSMGNRMQWNHKKETVFTQYFTNQIIGLAVGKDGKMKEVGRYPLEDKADNKKELKFFKVMNDR